METLEEVLAHYGVLGMKWGVRKDNSPRLLPGARSSMKVGRALGNKVNEARARIKKDIAERTSTEVTVRAKPGSMVRVVGGVRRMPHHDAIAARTSEQIAKKNTLDALSNKDLQHLVNRMNLEQQYRNLAVKETRKSAGQKMAEDLMSSKGDVVFAKLGPHAATGKKVAEYAFKRATANKAMNGGIVSKDKDKKK